MILFYGTLYYLIITCEKTLSKPDRWFGTNKGEEKKKRKEHIVLTTLYRTN